MAKYKKDEDREKKGNTPKESEWRKERREIIIKKILENI